MTKREAVLLFRALLQGAGKRVDPLAWALAGLVPVTDDQLAEVLGDEGAYVDYSFGRSVKMDFWGYPEMPSLSDLALGVGVPREWFATYDRDAGPGAGQRALEAAEAAHHRETQA